MSENDDRIARLSEQQRTCLRFVHSHYTTKEIAALLGIEPASVDRHIKSALRMLRVDHRRTAARILAKQEGPLVEDEDASAPLGRGSDAGETAPAERPRTPAPGEPPAPPRAGEALVGLFCGSKMKEAVLGDLLEKFDALAERRGAPVAKAWYWSQAGRSALFFAVRWARRLLVLEAILRRMF